jgi:hypothetical protein
VQRRVFGLAVLVVVAAAGCGGDETTTVTVTAGEPAKKEGLGPPAETLQFGHIDSLTPKDDEFELRFDPAWFLSGETANVAAAEDGVIERGEPDPNDNDVVEEGHRLLTCRVPPDAGVTVLTRKGDPAQMGATAISVEELAEIVSGTSAFELIEPLSTAVWITVEIDTVRAIDQQYRP